MSKVKAFLAFLVLLHTTSTALSNKEEMERMVEPTKDKPRREARREENLNSRGKDKSALDQEFIQSKFHNSNQDNNNNPYQNLTIDISDVENVSRTGCPNDITSDRTAPFMGRIEYRVGTDSNNQPIWKFVCSCFYITPNAILTSGTCCDQLKGKEAQTRLSFGVTLINEEPYKYQANGIWKRDGVYQILYHPLFNRDTCEHNLCLINPDDYLMTDYDLNVLPMCCADVHLQPVGSKAPIVYGWGRVANTENCDYLQGVNVNIVDHVSCWVDWLFDDDTKRVDSHKNICACPQVQTDRICTPDSSGILVFHDMNNKQKPCWAGIASFGPSTCADKSPTVFTSSSAYSCFINQNIGV